MIRATNSKLSDKKPRVVEVHSFIPARNHSCRFDSSASKSQVTLPKALQPRFDDTKVPKCYQYNCSNPSWN